MSTTLEHRNEFIIDTENILDRLSRELTRNNLDIKKIYREIHSLKGAAGFAGLFNMEQTAHTLEGLVSGIRNGEICLDDESEKILFSSLDYFTKDIKQWKVNFQEVDTRDLLSRIENKSLKTRSIAIEVVDDSVEESFFSDFEKTLLKEAMYRGEQFYRIICHIDRDEEMKYPRLFLVVNNLEKITNVIKTYPPMADVSKNQSREITLFLTTPLSKSHIYKGLSFDRVREVEVLRLDYSSILNDEHNRDFSYESNLYGKTIEVETSRIEEIFNYSQDLSSKLIQEEYVIPGKRAEVETLLSEMKKSLTSLTLISVDKAFSYFKSYCDKLAKELGKSVDFTITGGDILIERELGETLKELLIQLVKNSLDHGIESRDERLAKGKSERGRLMLKVSDLNGSLAVSLSDDGRGVDIKNAFKHGISNNYIDPDEEISLLSLLSRPGFSTSKDINYYSGRGIGLDIVVNRVINSLDGKINIQNNPGSGLSVNILIPPSSAIVKYTLFKYRETLFGISLVNIIEKITIDPDSVVQEDGKTLSYNHSGILYPVYTPWGRLSSSSPLLNEKYGFIIRYLGKKAFFPVDEFVLEKEYLSSSVRIVDTTSSVHKRLKVGDKVENFTLILPSIINC